MNAGAYGSELSTYVESVEWVDEQGEIHVSDSESLDFSYRHSFFTDHPGIVCSVVLQCVRGNTEDIAALIHDLDARRREKQPLEYPSAGSSFKRPEGYYAGKLIEDCGLKGCRVGGACVSEKHAGFIVNTGGATSRDVFALVEHITEVVYQRFGVVLEPEIRFLEAE